MSDRVMVMHQGRITGILEKEEADQETILSLASPACQWIWRKWRR